MSSKEKVEKVILFSILVSANLIVWTEILGIEFLYVVIIVTCYIAFFPRRWKK